MKVHVFFNPHSGRKKRTRKVLNAFLAYLVQQECPYEIYETQGYQKDQNLDNCLDDATTHIVVVGGDGTINEVVNGLTVNLPISIIPAGTGNDFVKNIALGNTLKEQFETALNGTVKTIDLGICNERKFVNGVGIGFDGQIVEDMAKKSVPLLTGHAKYYYHVLQILAQYKTRTYIYHLDDRSYNNKLILMTVGNGTTFGGGFKLMPDAKIDDGQLEVCAIGDVSPLRRFLNVNRLSGGTHGKLAEVTFHQVQEVKIAPQPALFAHMDGERIGSPPFVITIEPAALQVRCLG